MSEKELEAEVSRLRARVERLQAENNDLQIQLERLIEDYDRPEVLPEHIQRISENQLKMIGELRAEVARLERDSRA